jgi:phage repressor protein C with HTH and peptisase S24 domain
LAGFLLTKKHGYINAARRSHNRVLLICQTRQRQNAAALAFCRPSAAALFFSPPSPVLVSCIHFRDPFIVLASLRAVASLRALLTNALLPYRYRVVNKKSSTTRTFFHAIGAGMTKLGEFIAARRAELGMSQEELGQAVGLSDAAIGKIERGETLRPNNLAAFSGPLNVGHERLRELAGQKGVPAFSLKAMMVGSKGRREVSSSNQPVLPFPDMATIPVLGAAYGGPSGDIIGVQNEVERIARPPNLAGVHDAYAVYVRGESMAPRYLPGELVCVNPHKPVPRGAYCVVQIGHAGEPPSEAYIKQFVDHDREFYRFTQLNPARELTWPTMDVAALHLIVGTMS